MNFMIKLVLSYAYKRALEISTWRSLVMLIGGTWATEHPDQVALIVPVCMAVVGLIGSFLPDSITGKKEDLPKIELVSKSEEPINDMDYTDNSNIMPNNSNKLLPESKSKTTERNSNEDVFGSGFGDK